MHELAEFITQKLVKKYSIKYEEALVFYIDMLGRRKLEHLLNNIDKYATFDELKKHYYGGK